MEFGARRWGERGGWSEGQLAIVCVRDGSIALPEAARIALGLIPGDPLLWLKCEEGLMIKRATPRHEELGRHRAHPAPILTLRRAQSQLT